MAQYVLIGGGEIAQRETEKIDRLLLAMSGKPSPSILFFPTAAGDSSSYADTFREYFYSLGCTVVESAFLSRETREQTTEKLRRADIVYLGGGDTAKLLNTFKKRKLIDSLKEEANKGKIIAGISAGAIALGETALISEPGEDFAATDGWGLIRNFSCIPHFTARFDSVAADLMRFAPGNKIITIRDLEAVIIRTDPAGKVLGAEMVKA